ncbi:MAG: hypothetical protein Q9219_001678 [cf. Caloplaca sp. 3 TL-2023]
MAEDLEAFFNPSSHTQGTKAKPGAQETHQQVLKREHARREFTELSIPAIGEDLEDGVILPALGQKDHEFNKKCSVSSIQDTPNTPAGSFNGAGGTVTTLSSRRQRTTSSATSRTSRFFDSLTSMSPSPKRMEAMEYKASRQRRLSGRGVDGAKSTGEYVTRWLGELRTSALRTSTRSLRREIHKTTMKLRKMKVDDADN